MTVDAMLFTQCILYAGSIIDRFTKAGQSKHPYVIVEFIIPEDGESEEIQVKVTESPVLGTNKLMTVQHNKKSCVHLILNTRSLIDAMEIILKDYYLMNLDTDTGENSVFKMVVEDDKMYVTHSITTVDEFDGTNNPPLQMATFAEYNETEMEIVCNATTLLAYDLEMSEQIENLWKAGYSPEPFIFKIHFNPYYKEKDKHLDVEVDKDNPASLHQIVINRKDDKIQNVTLLLSYADYKIMWEKSLKRLQKLMRTMPLNKKYTCRIKIKHVGSEIAHMEWWAPNHEAYKED